MTGGTLSGELFSARVTKVTLRSGATPDLVPPPQYRVLHYHQSSKPLPVKGEVHGPRTCKGSDLLDPSMYSVSLRSHLGTTASF